MIVAITELTECQAFSPVVRIESPHPLTLCFRGGGGGGNTLAFRRGGVGVPIQTRGQTLWYSRNKYSVYVLCGFIEVAYFNNKR
jgi:hypothetical protein